MSPGSAWRRESLAIKQVPTLRTLLHCCDEDLLIRVIVEEHAARSFDWEALTQKRRRAVEKRLASTLATMRSLPVRKKRKPVGLLLPEESFVLHARSGLMERRVSASLAFLDDAAQARRALAADEAASDSEGPQPHRFTLAPWEETLGNRVWLGGSWCCRERYLVIASAFWEMTYLGFEYERVCARQSEEKAKRMLGEGPSDRSGGEAAPAPPRPATVSDERRRQAVSFGLAEQDPFWQSYRDSSIACVARLNRECRRAWWTLLLDVVDRLEAP